jgi:cholesterol transport system auxiliary component
VSYRGTPLGVLLALALSGCSILHSNAPPEQAYYLRAAAPPAAAAAVTPASAMSLRIGLPNMGPGLETPRIMLLQADHRMNFYTGSRWPAPPADVIESLAVQTLRASGSWSSVEDSTSPFPSHYLLQIGVPHFEADYTAGDPPTVHVVFDCILGRRDGRDVIATFSASGSAPAAANRMSEVVAAFQQATDAALAALSQQALQAVSADRERAQNGAKPEASISR